MVNNINEKEIKVNTEHDALARLTFDVKLQQKREEIYNALKDYNSKEKLDEEIIREMEMVDYFFSFSKEGIDTVRERLIHTSYTLKEFLTNLIFSNEKSKDIIDNYLMKENVKLKDLLEVEQEQFQFYQNKAVEYQKKRENKIKELEWELHLYTKPLPVLPQLKKDSKLKTLKRKLVNKINKIFHHKEQKQESQYIAQIESQRD